MATPITNTRPLDHRPEAQAEGSSSTLASTVESARHIANRGGAVNLNQTLTGVFAKVQNASKHVGFGIGKGLGKLNKRPVNSANSVPSIQDNSFKNFVDGLEAWKNAATDGEDRAEAVKQILLARTGNKTELNLDCLRLTSLPPEIGQLTQLQHLNLSSNHLSSLPPAIGQLTQLLNLFLSSNPLGSLPPDIGKLRQLRELSLSFTQLSSLPPEIEELTQLQTLDLMANRALTQLPESLSDLQNLRWLDLDHCSRAPRKTPSLGLER